MPKTNKPDEMAARNMRRAIELLFFAYRDFTAGPDALLMEYGYGRAHHRVLYFVGANGGFTVGELLAILKITKQSLSRVLSQLVDEGFIVQKADPADGRRRRLYLTDKGNKLESRLRKIQSDLLQSVFSAVGPDAVQGFDAVLKGIINKGDRQRF